VILQKEAADRAPQHPGRAILANCHFQVWLQGEMFRRRLGTDVLRMRFDDFVAVIESTLLVDHGVDLHRAHSGDGRVEWFVGALTLRLDVETIESVTLSANIEDATISPVSYAMTLRGARDVARDLAAMTDVPTEKTR